MNDKAKNREITKPRLVAALLSELDASGAVVLAESVEPSGVFHSTLQCQFKIPFEDTRVVLDSTRDDVKALRCVCCYGGQRISFELQRTAEKSWGLPKIVTLSDLRADRRIAFADRMYSAEMVGNRGVQYGYAVDVNRDCLAVDVDSKQFLQEGEKVKVIVRMVNTNFDVFYSDASVALTKAISQDKFRVILRLEQPSEGQLKQRRHERIAVESSSLKVSSNSFADAKFTSGLKIVNISTGGMTVSARNDSDSAQVVPGLILHSSDPDLSFLVVWVQGRTMGIRPLLFDPTHLARWYEYVDQVAPPEDRMLSVTRRELADLLTHSGLLKGSRRIPLGRDAQAHVIAGSAGESPLLIQRCIVRGGSGHAGLHVSSKRIAELSWFFGEGAALTERQGEYNAMLEACTSRMAWMSKHSHLFCRYLTGIWHYTVKSTASWGEEIGKSQASIILDSYQSSIKATAPCPLLRSTQIVALSSVSAQKRRDVSLQFHPMLFEAFAGGDGTHPVLNSELGRFGPYHRAVTKLVDLSGGGVVLAHRIFTHNIWSSTGVTNSVFVLVPGNLASEELHLALSSLAADEISHGTDDFLVIFDGPSGICDSYRSALADPKRFSFLIHDLSMNENETYRDEEESIVLRKRKSDA